MRNNYLVLFFVFFITYDVFSSSKTIEGEIDWMSEITYRVNENTVKKCFNFKGVSYDSKKDNLCIYSHQIKLNLEEIVSVSVVDIEYEIVNKETIKTISGINFIDSDIDLSFVNGVNKKVNYGIISFIPVIYDSQNDTYKKVKKYKLDVVTRHKAISKSKEKMFTSSSVLETGEWFKIGVVREGVFKLTYSFLKDLGMDLKNIDASSIKIYGSGGKMLPERNSEFRYDDLQQNAIYIFGELDGSFDKDDYILFYGQEPDRWTYNSSSNRFSHTRNIYSDTSFYFITASNTGDIPKRITTQNSTGSATNTVTTFNDYAFYEKDLVNVIKSGSRWFGESFDIRTDYDFIFNFPNIDRSSPVLMNVSVAGRSDVPSNFAIKSGNTTLLNIPIGSVSVSSSNHGSFFRIGSDTTSFTSSEDVISLNISYNKPNSVSIGWLDEIELNVRRSLVMSQDQLFFRDLNSVGVGNISEFIISNANEIDKVWDITDPLSIKEQNFDLSNGTLRYTLPTDSLKNFVALTNNYSTQVFAKGIVENQNLHSINQLDMIILSHPDFLSQADQVAQFHSEEGLTVKVITPQQIYNEYSSGSQDIVAVRDFIRMLYNRASTADDLPKYLLLFGDGSYDNKNRIVGNSNFIPTYQSPNSTDIIGSYVSDDYYGLLDENEGAFETTAELMDISIGRLPVKNSVEANNVVNKILNYNTTATMEDWRNKIAFVGDDEDGNIHMDQANRLAEIVEDDNKSYNVDKVFFDAFKQEATSGGSRYPEVNEKINEIVNEGALVLNYTGHGGEVGWATERVLSIADINSWRNKDAYPLLITATCEFSRFDDPQRTSAGELVLINEGGGIALLTTVRLVFSSPNFTLNQSFYNIVFDQVNNQDPTLGEVFRAVKNLPANANNSNNRNFTLLGDPALRLAYPKYDVTTTKFNGVNVTSSLDTISALSKVTIEGIVQNQNGEKLTNFNGIISPTVFDKAQEVVTLQNDGNNPFNFEIQTNKLFKGKVSVRNGDFSFSFIVPKDISFNFGRGKLSYYAENQVEDAHGSYTDFLIGGTATNAEEDKEGPELSLFMNDENFVFGGTTDENPVLLAKVEDLHGINTVGNGIGHDIVAVLDDETEKSFILNDFYEADLDSYQKGTIRFPFKDLSEGRHKLSLKVWDVYNNSSEATIEFEVVKTKDITLKRVYNYPNPFTTYTEFWFEHNQPSKQLFAQVQIFSVAGKLVKTIEKNIFNEGFRSTSITWNGLDDYGDRLARGIYVYKLKVRAENFSVAEEYQKLVILR